MPAKYCNRVTCVSTANMCLLCHMDAGSNFHMMADRLTQTSMPVVTSLYTRVILCITIG